MRRMLLGCTRLAAIGVLLTIFTACAQPEIRSQVEATTRKISRTGDVVRLFHSGTADVKKIICPNDELDVYREVQIEGVTNSKAVGRVKVLKLVGENYFDAKVLEGAIRSGDVAKKETAYCMIADQPVKE